jgi:FtsH-binding integral membrane protein
MGLWVFFFAIYVVAVAVSLWSRSQIVGFLGDTPSIRSTSDLERFKELVRLEMYLALAMIVLLVTGLVVGLVLIRRDGAVVLLAVLVANGVVLGLGLFHKKVEQRARSLRTAEALDTEYRRVCYAWTKKPLPDF